jgi:phytoene dehydrogenase-like protein|tara:strand:- start:1476 stop:3047 length:1572 start_codon:yes stop_codon:yes gene_type:complete
MTNYDSIVIGSGVNSLVAATMLGKKGKKVLLLEARNEIGGLSSCLEFGDGYKCNMIYDSIKWIDPRVLKELKLKNNGLKFIKPDVVRIALGEDGKHIFFNRDPLKTEESISNLSKEDSTKWGDFVVYINKITQFLEKLYTINPPELPNLDFSDILSLKPIINPLLKQGSRGIVDLLRVAPMMMNELMDEWFENELLRSSISVAGIHHLSFGPYAAGTGYNLLHQHLYCNGVFHNSLFIKGGTVELANTLKNVAESYGVEIHTNSKVKSIEVKQNNCDGVVLDNGELIKAEKIISGLDPNNTFINLVGASNLDPNFLNQIQNIKYRGSTARIHFAINSIPNIKGINPDQMGTNFSICSTIESLERASDGVKHRKISENPYVEFNIPSALDPDFPRSDKHVLSATVQYAPYHLRNENWDNESNDLLEKNVIKVIERIIPNFSSMIESSIILSPLDIEKEFCLNEGNLNHGEMTLDQFMFMRPTISSSQYNTPIDNLFICGPGTHPGGGLHGSNGYNAAKKILSQW